jgi:hypothetical protein
MSKKKNTVREIATSEPILLEVANDDNNNEKGVIYLDQNDKLAFKWGGQSSKHVLYGEFTGGYIAFENFTTGTIFDSIRGQKTVHPDYVLYSTNKEAIELESYEFIRITFKNMFVGMKANIDGQLLKSEKILESAGLKDLKYNDLDVDVWVTGTTVINRYPFKLSHSQDVVTFQLSGDIRVDDVLHYIKAFKNAITLFTKKPCDPMKVELGIKKDGEDFPKLVNYERSIEWKYSSRAVDYDEGIDVDTTLEQFFKVVGSLLEHKDVLATDQWLGYIESRDSKYYLDTIFSNLLTNAEAAFGMLPPTKNELKRDTDFDNLISLLEADETLNNKLKKWVIGAKKQYAESKPYAEKLTALMKNVGITFERDDIIRAYLNTLRNDLMHGNERNWSTYTVEDKDGKETVYEINVGQVLTQLEKLVQANLIKQLSSTAPSKDKI